jgi:hypothetical protein
MGRKCMCYCLTNNVLKFRYQFSIKYALKYAFWTHIDHNPIRALEAFPRNSEL